MPIIIFSAQSGSKKFLFNRITLKNGYYCVPSKGVLPLLTPGVKHPTKTPLNVTIAIFFNEANLSLTDIQLSGDFFPFFSFRCYFFT